MSLLDSHRMPRKNEELEARVAGFLELVKLKDWRGAIEHYNVKLKPEERNYLKAVYLGPVVTAFREYRLLPVDKV